MPLKAVYLSQDDIPEEIRDEYEEAKGKWALKVEDLETHPTIAALAKANKENIAKRDQFKAKAAELEERLAGYPEEFDPLEYDALKAAAEGKEPPRSDEQVARMREQLERKHAAELARKELEIAEAKKRAERIEAQRNKRVLDDGLTRELIEAGVDTKLLPAARALLKERGGMRVVEEDDDVRAVVETDLGELSLTDHVKTWIGGDGSVFVAKADSTGANGQTRSRTFESNPFSKSAWNKTSQGQLLRQDRLKAERLAKAAGFTDIDAASRAAAPVA